MMLVLKHVIFRNNFACILFAVLIIFLCQLSFIRCGITIYDFPRHQQTEKRLLMSQIALNYTPPYYAHLQWVSWHVRLLSCGGAIISRRWVLTAASCINRINSTDPWLEVHIYRHQAGGPIIKYNVDMAIRHYAFNIRDVNRFNVGLVKTVKFIEFSRYIRPVALISYDFNYFEYPVLISGYKIAWDLRLRSTQAASCESTGHLACRHVHINRHTICLLSYATTDLTCTGEAGNPMVADGALIGVRTSTENCYRPNENSQYTRIWVFREWITTYIAAPYDYKQPTLIKKAKCMLD